VVNPLDAEAVSFLFEVSRDGLSQVVLIGRPVWPVTDPALDAEAFVGRGRAADAEAGVR
jgi:hypothetical protein